MLAPLLIATRRLPRQPSRATYCFRPATRQRAGRLDDRARVLEHVLDGGADLVGVGQQHLVDQTAAQREGLLAHAPHRDAVGEHADALERHALARRGAIRTCEAASAGSTPMIRTAG